MIGKLKKIPVGTLNGIELIDFDSILYLQSDDNYTVFHLVDNTKFNSDRLLLKIAAILERDYGAKGHIIRRKHNAGVPAHDEIINEFIEKCDVVVAGVGD